MKTLLKNIASIQTGIFAKPVSKGEIVYLQAKHFNENGQLLTILYPDLKADDVNEKHLLRQGDILFAAKGTKNFAAVYEMNDIAAVASTTFFVIRIIGNAVLPDYLAWVLNNPVSQNFLKKNAIGSAIVSISKAVLEELEVVIPPIEKQKNILEIAKLSKRENSILSKIAELKHQQIQQQIINAIK